MDYDDYSGYTSFDQKECGNTPITTNHPFTSQQGFIPLLSTGKTDFKLQNNEKNAQKDATSQVVKKEDTTNKNDTEVFHCKVCATSMNGRAPWNQHVAGARHKKNEERAKTGAAPLGRRNGGGVAAASKNKSTNKLRVQAILNACKDPLIGLQYITEFQKEDPSVEARYVCNLCEAKCDPRTLTCHVVGQTHRQKYLKEHYMHYHAAIATQKLKKSEITTQIKQYAEEIEKEEGRKEMKVKVELDPFYQEKLQRQKQEEQARLKRERGRGREGGHGGRGRGREDAYGGRGRGSEGGYGGRGRGSEGGYGGRGRGRGSEGGGYGGRGRGRGSERGFGGRDNEHGYSRGRGRGYDRGDQKRYYRPNESDNSGNSHGYEPLMKRGRDASHLDSFNQGMNQGQYYDQRPQERFDADFSPSRGRSFGGDYGGRNSHGGYDNSQGLGVGPSSSSGDQSNTGGSTGSALGILLGNLSKTLVNNEEEATVALEVSNALTQALLQYRMKNLPEEFKQNSNPQY